MKKLFYTSCLALFSVATFAQNAKQILDNVSNHYKNQKSVYIKFKSELENSGSNTKDSYTGEVYVKGDKYNLTVPKMDIRQIYDGKKLYTISSENQEVTVSKPEKGSDELFTPTRVLDIYKDGYTLSLDKKQGNIQFIKLVPTKKSELKYIIVGVDTSKNQLVKLSQTNNKNTTTTFTVQKQVDDIIIPSALLNFSKKFYKDYYISEI
ncbi:outer membrane lipoprotein carrier protein LolA [Ornithobacterium rhinotracheale]|uniref:LolA family protein n=1 Tax=Ornithobacterium rhinotracheale TaxID=28251 RepID=UPI00129C4EF3|nr:LolA-like putative outer membrane lipoprotein chaperone [Ornithobacterium rhinotracheale]MRI64336.1 outer membrane lipoprotein carrier protein LolA [Ornithobacterium rhinotracheale]